MEIEIRSHHFKLLPQKAVFWKEAKTLLVSDLHLGKVTHFRKEGIAIPTAVFGDNFKRLDELILTNNVYRIIYLGDLFHNRHNAEWELFAKWRSKYHSVEMTIVLGNHDILPQRLFDENKITVYADAYRESQFLFAHHPGTKFENDIYIFCGHIHPVFCLRAKGRQSIKLPCFVFDEMQAVLPSFGVFTGGYEMKVQEKRRIFMIVKDHVLEKGGNNRV
jgi:DNA ligase-associated metallophosphoesterase